MLDIKSIRYIVTLHDTGTVTQAAEKLCMSQPTLTNHLSRLESKLGEKLFLRTSRGLEITPIGQALYERGKALLQQWSAFDQEVQLLTGAEIGDIRVVCGAVIEQEILPKAIIDFLKQHPSVNIEVEVIDPEKMLERINNGAAEIAIGAFPDTGNLAVNNTSLGSQKIGFYTRPNHPALQKKLSLKSSSSTPFIIPLAAPQIPVNILEWLKTQGLNFTEHRLLSNSYKLLIETASETDLAVAGPQFIFSDAVKSGRLTELLVTDTPDWHVSVLVPQSASHSKIVQKMVDCITDALKLKI